MSVTTVVSTGGNIIRNCGSGIDAYATGKITTANNVILGPADEFIASPDIYDTDFDSINITIDHQTTFEGPELLYIEDGQGKDISSSKVDIVAGIGTMVGLFSTTRTATLGDKFLNFNVVTQDEEAADGNDRESGYLQLKLTAAQTATLSSYAGAATTALGYEVIGTEYLEKPVGFSTVVGITSGYWANGAGYGAAAGGFVNITSSAGVGVTQYVVRLENANQISGISTGDIVQLPGHSMTPNLTAGVTVGMKDENNATITAANGLRVDKVIIPDRIVLTGFTTTGQSHGSNPIVGDYISIRRIFTIAKGRVGVN